MTMTRADLIEALVEGEFRRAVTHATGPHGLVGRTAVRTVAHFLPGKNWKYSTAGQAGGAALSYADVGKQLKDMDDTVGSNEVKQAAAKKFAAKNRGVALFNLPKDEVARKRLANRGVLGHIGHGALRMVGGPFNVARYANKVSYARAGFHRGADSKRRGVRESNMTMPRADLIEALVEVALGMGLAQHNRIKYEAKHVAVAGKLFKRVPGIVNTSATERELNKRLDHLPKVLARWERRHDKSRS